MIQEVTTSYSMCFRRYWCHQCKLEFRLQLTSADQMEQYCQSCGTVMEMVPSGAQNHPRHFEIYRVPERRRARVPVFIFYFTTDLEQPSQTTPTPAEKIAALNRSIVKENDNKEMCYICHDEYNSNDRLLNLNCKHNFHEDCVTKWLNVNNTCPCCRATI